MLKLENAVDQTESGRRNRRWFLRSTAVVVAATIICGTQDIGTGTYTIFAQAVNAKRECLWRRSMCRSATPVSQLAHSPRIADQD